jgi:hypothetical protein
MFKDRHFLDGYKNGITFNMWQSIKVHNFFKSHRRRSMARVFTSEYAWIFKEDADRLLLSALTASICREREMHKTSVNYVCFQN